MTKLFSYFFLISLISIGATVCPAQTSTGLPATQSNSTRSASDAAAKYFPNTILVTQDNQKVKFYDDLLKDKFVVINFIFTTCTTVCPPMTANLRKVQTLLAERGDQVNMISISVDPQTDTPERLKAFAQKFKAGPGWYFLTGDKANVDAVLHKLGGYVAEKNDHTVTLILGNVNTGEWKKLYALAKATDISAHISQMLEAKATK